MEKKSKCAETRAEIVLPISSSMSVSQLWRRALVACRCQSLSREMSHQAWTLMDVLEYQSMRLVDLVFVFLVANHSQHQKPRQNTSYFRIVPFMDICESLS
jgi:hypothetical protein